MIPENFKTALNIASKQLPEFITGGYLTLNTSTGLPEEVKPYENFIAFLEAYYEWLAETGNIEDRTKNLLNYKDIDKTLDEFEQFFYNEFLKYFPEETLANKRELVKLSKEFYRRKSTTAAFKFLFRALYNTDCHLYNTRESILIASDGKWVQSYYVRLKTVDTRFLKINGLKVLGETSKASAKIERSYFKEGYLEVQISDFSRKFFSGESIKIVDNFLNDVYFDTSGNIVTQEEGVILTGKLLGNIERVLVNPNFRGLFYKVGDPVLFVGGLNPAAEEPMEAEAQVSRVSTGYLKAINVIDGSNGFQMPPNTSIIIDGQNGAGAKANVSAVDLTNPANVYFAGAEVILPYKDVLLNGAYGFPKMPNANSETKLIDAFEVLNATTYPIKTVLLENGGSGFVGVPDVTAKSYLKAPSLPPINIKELGILAPIRINYPGFNYSNGDTILINGGIGIGAFANVSLVDANGTIQKISYIQKPEFLYPFGGMGYTASNLPTATIISQNNKIFSYTTTGISSNSSTSIALDSVANVKVGMYITGNGIQSFVSTFNSGFTSNTLVTSVNESTKVITVSTPLNNQNSIGDSYDFNGEAQIVITGILGDGAILQADTDIAGQVLDIELTNSGQDYISEPEVYLDIIDFRVSIYDEDFVYPTLGTKVYRSADGDPFKAEFTAKYFNMLPTEDSRFYKLRVYSYYGKIVNTTNTLLYVGNKRVEVDTNPARDNGTFLGYSKGVLQHGNGGAKANAVFEKGSVSGLGKYLNTDGFLSSDKVLESNIYNDFTYFLTVDKSFSAYKEVVKNILHPGGTQLIGRNSIKTKEGALFTSNTSPLRQIELKEVTYPLVYGVLSNTNILSVEDLNESLTGIPLSQVLTKGNYIALTSTNGEKTYTQIDDFYDSNNNIILKDHYLVEYANVGYGYTNGNSFIVTSLTDKFDLINNGIYSNTNNKLLDIVYPEDKLKIKNNTIKTINDVDYDVGDWIIYANTNLTVAGNADSPVLFSITRNFTANSILIDYSELEYKFLQGFGIMVTGANIDGVNLQTESGSNILVRIGAGYTTTEVSNYFIGVDGKQLTTENGTTKVTIPPILN